MQTHLGAISAPGDKGHSPLPGTGEGGTCTGEIYALLLGRWGGGQRALFTSVSQLPLTDNNPSANVA